MLGHKGRMHQRRLRSRGLSESGPRNFRPTLDQTCIRGEKHWQVNSLFGSRLKYGRAGAEIPLTMLLEWWFASQGVSISPAYFPCLVVPRSSYPVSLFGCLPSPARSCVAHFMRGFLHATEKGMFA